MNIERTFLGVNDNGHASLGSLEFIHGGQPYLLGWPAGGREHIDSPNSSSTETPEFDNHHYESAIYPRQFTT